MPLLPSLFDSLARGADRPMQRPAGLVYWLDTPSPLAPSFWLAMQHVAVQSVYFVLAAAPAAALSPDPAEATRFLCLSILAVALWQALQLLTRGPVGSGYPVPATHAPAMLGAYAAAGAAGVGFGGAAAMVLIAGIAASLLSFAMRRLRVLIPNEVAGVVVMLIGVSLILLGTQILGLQPGRTQPGPLAVVVLLGSIAAMVLVALSGTKLARLAVLVGAAFGVALAIILGEVPENAAAVIAASPWIALPQPWLPDFGDMQPAPLAAFLLALVAAKASAAGGFLMIQRAADAGWTRPDPPAVQRGLLANGLSIVAAGAIGAAAPGPATAAAGLSVATGTLARRIVWIGTAILVLVAFCPKIVALFVMAPAAVKAATLIYVSGFIIVQGAQLATVRLLDTRRSMVVALGMGAGITAAVAPAAFAAHVPALASPLALGAIIAFLANLATMPMVTQRAELRVSPGDEAAGREASEWAAATARVWGLRPQSARQMERALVELTEVLAGRGVGEVTAAARRGEDRLELLLAWQGPPLPEPSARPEAEDLLGDDTARDAFAVWLATREALSFGQRPAGDRCEARLVLED